VARQIIIGFKPGLWANGSARKPAASILPWPKYCPSLGKARYTSFIGWIMLLYLEFTPV
jgi:hypothetical protein